MAWVDAGVNITDKRVHMDTLLDDCRHSNVSRVVAIGTTLSNSQQAADYASIHTQILATAGIHPHYSKDAVESDYQQLKKLAARDEVVAIGECGLDFNRNFSPAEIQLQWFEKQLQLACELGKPVYLHERDAFPQQYALLERYSEHLVGGLVHCFTGTESEMEAYLGLGFHIGITGWLCDDKRGQALQNAVKSLPISHLILETDSPYLVPKSIRPRPKMSMPSHIAVIAQRFCDITGHSIKDVEQQTSRNVAQLFNCQIPTNGLNHYD